MKTSHHNANAEVIASDRTHLVRDLSDKQTQIAADMLNRIGSAYMHPHKRLRKLYELVDKWWTYSFGEAVVCSRGCHHCCRVNVNLTTVEAEYIAVNADLPEPDYSKASGRDYTNSWCPMLKNNECSIYEWRPLACRVFGTVDSVEYCKDDAYPSHQIIALTLPGGGGCEIANHAAEIIAHMNGPKHPVKDIRDFFGVAE